MIHNENLTPIWVSDTGRISFSVCVWLMCFINPPSQGSAKKHCAHSCASLYTRLNLLSRHQPFSSRRLSAIFAAFSRRRSGAFHNQERAGDVIQMKDNAEKERKKKQACVYTRLCFLSAVTHTQTVFAQGEYTHIFPHMGSNGGKESRWERGGFTLLQMEVCHKNAIWKLGRVGWQGRVQWKCGFPNQLSLYLFIYLSLIDAVSAVVTHPFNYTLPPWIKYFHVKSIGGPIFGFFADLWCAQSGWSLLRSWLLSLHTLGDNGTMSFTPTSFLFCSFSQIHTPTPPASPLPCPQPQQPCKAHFNSRWEVSSSFQVLTVLGFWKSLQKTNKQPSPQMCLYIKHVSFLSKRFIALVQWLICTAGRATTATLKVTGRWKCFKRLKQKLTGE